MNQSTNGLPEDAVTYMREKRIPDLMEHLLHELIVHQPENPLEYLAGVLSSPVTLKAVLCGPPGAGKAVQARLIAERYGVVCLTTRGLLDAEVGNKTPRGEQVAQALAKGEVLPDSMLIDLLVDRLRQKDAVDNGWLLCDFPRTKNQALALQTHGLLPQLFVALDVDEHITRERIEGRRVDPTTGHVYHLTYAPPEDPATLSRLEQRAEDTPERLTRRMANYQRNAPEVRDSYVSVLQRVDGNGSKTDVFDSIVQIIDAAKAACV